MLSLPGIGWITAPAPSVFNLASISEQETKCCRVIYQRFANEIMRFMAKRGAAPTVFSMDPSVTVDIWPTCTFTKGRTYDARGIEQVVAVPLGEPCKEMPESGALFYQGEHV
jgi:hypothetical protein